MEGLKNELIEMLERVVLPEVSRINEQCIYKVPQGIRLTNPKAYTPQIISIGPFHNPHGSISNNNILHQMEELKLKYLKGFLNRTNLCMADFVLKLKEWEIRIRSCYAELVSFNSNEFLKIIIIDACFIIEFFLRFFSINEYWMKNDPILSKTWLFDSIIRDLVLLENQLPFFVLEDIYKLASLNLEFPSFITITLNYFNAFNFNPQNIKAERAQCPKHFTDLLRTFLLPSSCDFVQEEMGNAIEHVYSVSQLSEAGLVFQVSESKCLLDLKFDKGALKMPCFHIHATTEIYMRNIVAFEECHVSDQNYITQYLAILDFLINTEKDVSILVDKKIIVNWMGDANVVATMVNNLCDNVSMPGLNSKYQSLCKGLNGFYENPRNKYKAIFVHEYFNTPWKIASTITAVLLLLFTFIQAVCSIWSLFKK